MSFSSSFDYSQFSSWSDSESKENRSESEESRSCGSEFDSISESRSESGSGSESRSESRSRSESESRSRSESESRSESRSESISESESRSESSGESRSESRSESSSEFNSESSSEFDSESSSECNSRSESQSNKIAILDCSCVYETAELREDIIENMIENYPNVDQAEPKDRRYKYYASAFSKGFSHSLSTGLLENRLEYDQYVKALETDNSNLINKLNLGKPLVDPLSSLNLELVGRPQCSIRIPAPPKYVQMKWLEKC